MLCLIFNIHNPLNYDVCFVDRQPDGLPLPHFVSSYQTFDKETNSLSDPIRVNVYKTRLKGIIKRRPSQDQPIDGYVKHKLIQWSNRTGGAFFYETGKVDEYGRLEIDLIDPVSKRRFSDYLTKKYPQKYKKWR